MLAFPLFYYYYYFFTSADASGHGIWIKVRKGPLTMVHDLWRDLQTPLYGLFSGFALEGMWEVKAIY